MKPGDEGCGARVAQPGLRQRFPQVRSWTATGSPTQSLLSPLPTTRAPQLTRLSQLPQPGFLSRLPSSRSPQPAPLSRSPQSSPLGRVSSAGSPQRVWAASGDRAEGWRRQRESPVQGSRSWTRLRRPRRPEERRREWARGRPSPLAAACGQTRGGDSEAGPVTGAGPGEAGNAPRSRLLPEAYRALSPRAAAAASTGHATNGTLPAPSASGPGPPRPRLPRAGRGPARAAGAGRTHGRRKEAAARPSPLQIPSGVETRSPGPGGCVSPAGGEGWWEEAAAPLSAL